MRDIKVYVIDYKNRKYLQMRYIDPITGKQKMRSTGVPITRRRKAEKVAAKWEHDLQEGRSKDPSKITWAAFRERYEDEKLPGLADRTAGKVAATFNAVEHILDPQRLAAMTAGQVSKLQGKLRDNGLAESTIKGHLAHLKAALNWAKRVGLLNEVPTIDTPRRAKGSRKMKGRPITGEEFDRLLSKTAEVVGEAGAESWRHYLRGLWWSGLRLEESLHLYWDRDDKLLVDLDGRFPMLHIPAELEKGHQDRLLPIAPQFGELLLATPEDRRSGPVFAPCPTRPERTQRLGGQQVGRTISKIGRAAGVKVDTDPRTGKVKYASAHDLRRSFGERWAALVMPQTLMELMRHEAIETTLRFYVGRNAEKTAEQVYAAISGSTLGSTARIPAPAEVQENAEATANA